MEIKKFLFLLDENVDANLFKLLKSDGFNVTTVQREGWGGYRNGKLCNLIQGKDIIFSPEIEISSFYGKNIV